VADIMQVNVGYMLVIILISHDFFRSISTNGTKTCKLKPSFTGSVTEFMSSYEAADTDVFCCECWS